MPDSTLRTKSMREMSKPYSKKAFGRVGIEKGGEEAGEAGISLPGA
jgi:hypothetical protein